MEGSPPSGALCGACHPGDGCLRRGGIAPRTAAIGSLALPDPHRFDAAIPGDSDTRARMWKTDVTVNDTPAGETGHVGGVDEGRGRDFCLPPTAPKSAPQGYPSVQAHERTCGRSSRGAPARPSRKRDRTIPKATKKKNCEITRPRQAEASPGWMPAWAASEATQKGGTGDPLTPRQRVFSTSPGAPHL